jgi:hypothetical protein
MTKTKFLFIVIFGLLAVADRRVHAQVTLQCESPDLEQKDSGSVFVTPASALETARMLQAPHGASRAGKHILLVHWANGIHTYKDKPPYEQLAGVLWTYCGYNPAVGFHLIRKEDVDLFTGILLNESTGALLPGGYSVSFSPDRQSYISWDQENGMDEGIIKLYSIHGTLLWKGFSGLISQDGKSVYPDFDSVYWNNAGKLIAEYQIPDKGKFIAILTQTKNSHWRWVSRISK